MGLQKSLPTFFLLLLLLVTLFCFGQIWEDGHCEVSCWYGWEHWWIKKKISEWAETPGTRRMRGSGGPPKCEKRKGKDSKLRIPPDIGKMSTFWLRSMTFSSTESILSWFLTWIRFHWLTWIRMKLEAVLGCLCKGKC